MRGMAIHSHGGGRGRRDLRAVNLPDQPVHVGLHPAPHLVALHVVPNHGNSEVAVVTPPSAKRQVHVRRGHGRKRRGNPRRGRRRGVLRRCRGGGEHVSAGRRVRVPKRGGNTGCTLRSDTHRARPAHRRAPHAEPCHPLARGNTRRRGAHGRTAFCAKRHHVEMKISKLTFHFNEPNRAGVSDGRRPRVCM